MTRMARLIRPVRPRRPAKNSPTRRRWMRIFFGHSAIFSQRAGLAISFSTFVKKWRRGQPGPRRPRLSGPNLWLMRRRKENAAKTRNGLRGYFGGSFEPPIRYKFGLQPLRQSARAALSVTVENVAAIGITRRRTISSCGLFRSSVLRARLSSGKCRRQRLALKANHSGVSSDATLLYRQPFAPVFTKSRHPRFQQPSREHHH